MRITGKTRVMFILADPVAHVIGTDVLNRSFDAMGLDIACAPLHVAPEHLDGVMQTLRTVKNVAGFGCTIPHKTAALGLMDHLTPAARSVGAVNFVRRNTDGSLTGHNIDGAGFMAGLAAAGHGVAGKRVLQIGAGGVGKAIAFALAEAGARELVVANRSTAKAQQLASAVVAAVPECRLHGCDPARMPAPRGFDLIVNCTSLGMKPDDPLPFDPEGLGPGQIVAEVVMTPAMTPVMARAAAQGCAVVPGLAMMEPQPGLLAEFLGVIARGQ